MVLTPMFEEPVVVLAGQQLRLAFQTSLDILSGGPSATGFKSDDQGRDGVNPALKLEVDNNTWVPFPDSEAHTRPANWLMRWYQGNVTQRNRAYGIELKHAAVEDHGNWTVTIVSNTTDFKTESRTFEVIVAKGPRDVVFKSDRFQVSLTLYYDMMFGKLIIRMTSWSLIKKERMRSPRST